MNWLKKTTNRFLKLPPKTTPKFSRIISSSLIKSLSVVILSYCWWLKSCITRDVWNPVNNGRNYQPQLVIAGFQASTVWSTGHQNSAKVQKATLQVAPQQSGHRVLLLWCCGHRPRWPQRAVCLFFLFWQPIFLGVIGWNKPFPLGHST